MRLSRHDSPESFSTCRTTGPTYDSGTANHALTLYRHSSGALVFGAGTVQWTWGLDSEHDSGSGAPSLAMQQATMNLLADMGAQPLTPRAGLVTQRPVHRHGRADLDDDVTERRRVCSGQLDGHDRRHGCRHRRRLVGGVEVSVDGGVTWHRATGRAELDLQLGRPARPAP